VDGTWENVIIDDFFPYIGNRPAFMHSQQKEIWCMLIEKAYAKAYGGYLALEAGNSHEAFADLLGFPAHIFKITGENTERLWEMLSVYCSSGSPMALSTPGDFKQVEAKLGMEEGEARKKTGLIPRHAFSVLHAKEYKGVRLVKIRNPWGSGEWTGKFSDNDTESWTKDFKDYFGFKKSNDGIFFMEFSEVEKYFSTLYICTLISENGKKFHEARAKGELQKFPEYVSWQFVTKKKSIAVITLYQHSSRHLIAPRSIDMDITVVDESATRTIIARQGKGKSMMTASVDPGTYRIIVHSRENWTKGDLKSIKFAMSVHCEEQVSLKLVNDGYPEKALNARKKQDLETYHIISGLSGLALDGKGAPATKKLDKGNKYQEWIFETNGRILCAGNRKAVDIPRSTVKSGTEVILYPHKHNGDNQKFVRKSGMLVSLLHSELALTVTSKEDGAKLRVCTITKGSANHMWRIEKVK